MTTPFARRLAGALICSLGAPLAASAAEPVHEFDCDTPPGHYSYWTQSLSSGAVEVSGAVTVNELRKHKKWVPVASVMFRGADGKSNAGVSLSALLKVNDMYFVRMKTPAGDTDMGLGGVIPRTKDPIPFKVTFDATGKLTVSIAGAEATAELGTFRPQILSLSCSTGDFRFTNVVVQDSAR